jgi:hypothetical protein
VIAEIRSNRRLQLIIICIALSILLHLIIIYINLTLKPTPDTAPLFPPSKQKPMTILKRPPAKTQPAPPPTPPHRRIHKAGTSTHAPKTEQALTPDPTHTPQATKIPTPTQVPQVPPSTPQPSLTPPKQPMAKPTKPPEAAKNIPVTEKPRPTRRPMQRFFDDAIKKEQQRIALYTKPDDAPFDKTDDHAAPTKEYSSLSFLAPDNIYTDMRSKVVHQPGIAEQYGDLKYLHYNRKIYQALQQSINIALRNLSQNQYNATFESIQRPARVRFSLDKNGRPHHIRITMSSGNAHYDTLVQNIVQSSAFPPIPQSFNMHTTHHAYGVILYDDGKSHENIGVSPYLEGE